MTQNVEPKFKRHETSNFSDFRTAVQRTVTIGVEEEMKFENRGDGSGMRPKDSSEKKIRIRRHSVHGNSPESFSVHFYKLIPRKNGS